MQREYLAALVVMATVTGLCGCGKRLHPVGGQLVWEDGKPAKELAGAIVYFESTEHRTVSRSVVQADGHFQLTTEKPESSGADGVPPGLQRVYVVDGLPSLVDPRFRRPDTSGLQVTVPPDGPVVLRLTKARAPRNPLRKITTDDER